MTNEDRDIIFIQLPLTGLQDRDLRQDVAVHGAEQQRVVLLQQGGGGARAEGGRAVRLHDGEHRGGLRC